MKKKLAALLAMSMLLTGALAGCGGSDEPAQDDTAENTQSATQDESAESTETTGGTLRMGTNATFPPYETTDGVMKLYGHLVASAEKYGLAVPSKSHLGGASDASRIDAPVLCSCGVPGSGNHTSSEYADVEGFFERAKLLCAAILEADSFAEA